MSNLLEDGLRWIEQMCVELGRNPAQATRALEEFRDSPQALDVCWAILQSSRASASAEFHILSAAKHALLFKWDSLPIEHRQQWLQWMESSLNLRVSANQPTYVINKFIQVYVSIRKRAWLTSTSEEKTALLSFLASCLENPTASYQFLGASLLLFLVEEFHITTSADVNVSIQYYAQTKTDFQTTTIPIILSLCWSKLNQLTVDATSSSQAPLFGLFPILIKTMAEIVSWEYASYDHVNNSLANDENASVCFVHKPPRLFADIILQPAFLDKIFTIYRAFRAFQQQLQQQSRGRNGLNSNGNNHGNHSTEIENTILELRNLINVLVSINGEIFANDEAKAAFGNTLLVQVCMITEPHVQRRTLQLLTFESDDYDEGGLRAEEIFLLLQSFSTLLNNFSLLIIVAMPQFSTIMNLIGQISVEICGEIDCLTADVRVRLQRSDFHDIAEMNIASTWRFDVFTFCLEVWTQIQDNFSLVCHTTLVASPAQGGGAQGGGLGSAAVASFRAWLMDISERLFPRAFECVLMVLVNDCLAAADDVTGEEMERIEDRLMESLLAGTAALGRLHAVKAMQLIGSKLQGSLQDYQIVYQNHQNGQAATGSGGNDGVTAWTTKNLFCLEHLRIGLLILQFLLVDDFSIVDAAGSDPDSASSSSSGSGASGTSARGSLSASGLTKGGESPVISSWILQALQDDPQSIQVLWEAFRFTASLLQFEIHMLTTPHPHLLQSSMQSMLGGSASSNDPVHPCVSPLLLTTLFRFFTCIVVRYIDPDIEHYADETVELYPFLHPHSGSLFHLPLPAQQQAPQQTLQLHAEDVNNAMLQLLLSSFVAIIDRLPGETELVVAASVTLHAITQHCHPMRLYHLLTSSSSSSSSSSAFPSSSASTTMSTPNLLLLLSSYDTLLRSSLPSFVWEQVVRIITQSDTSGGSGSSSTGGIQSVIVALFAGNGILSTITATTGSTALANEIQAAHYQGRSLLRRLSDEGMIGVTAALGGLLLKSPEPAHHLLFSAMCESLYNSLSALQQLHTQQQQLQQQSASAQGGGSVFSSASSATAVNLVLAAIAGIIRCDATQDHALAAIYQLSATVWQWMSWHLPALLSNNVETVHTCGNLIYDFAECQLGKVSASNAVGLGAAGDVRTQLVQSFYTAVLCLFRAYKAHVSRHVLQSIDSPDAADFAPGIGIALVPSHSNDSGTSLGNHNNTNNMHNTNHNGGSGGSSYDLLQRQVTLWEAHALQMLDICNLLADKQFFIASTTTGVGSAQAATSSASNAHGLYASGHSMGLHVDTNQLYRQQLQLQQPYDTLQDLASVLCLGLEILVPLMAPRDVLRNYPRLASKYVSFAAYLLGGEVDGFVRWVNHTYTLASPVYSAHVNHMNATAQLVSAPSSTASVLLGGFQHLLSIATPLSPHVGHQPHVPSPRSLEQQQQQQAQNPRVYFAHLILQLYETSTHVDSATARQALQALQNLCVHQYKALLQQHQQQRQPATASSSSSVLLVHASHHQVFSALLFEMTRSLLLTSTTSANTASAVASGVTSTSSPSKSNHHMRGDAEPEQQQARHLSADRLDAFAGVYWALVLLVSLYGSSPDLSTQPIVPLQTVDTLTTFQYLLQTVMASAANETGCGVPSSYYAFTATRQQQVWGLVRQLFSDRGVSLQKVDKPTRVAFAKNFRDFLRQLRSLTQA